MKDLGLDELGYVYLTIDDRWSLPDRDNVTGVITPYAVIYATVVIFNSFYR